MYDYDTEENIENFLREKIISNNYLMEKYIKYNNKLLKNRQIYDQIIKYVNKFLIEDTYHRIITLPGLRGLGKTTLLFQIYDDLLKKGIKKEKIIYINTEKLIKIPNADLFKACEIFIKNINNAYPYLNEKLFILIDEAQRDPEWAKTAKILYDEYPNIFLIFTGSKAIDIEITSDAVRRIKRIPIYPLNFSEYLNLKEDVNVPTLEEYLSKIYLTGKIEEIKNIENEILFNKLPQLKTNPNKLLDQYLKLGGFGYSIKLDEYDIIEATISVLDQTIEKDMRFLKDMNISTEDTTKEIINLLATEKPGEISYNTIANTLDIKASQVKILLETFEKTHLMFHYDAYGSPSKRSRREKKYHFLTPTIKYAINKNYGYIHENPKQIMGPLTEDLVASRLFLNKYYKKTFNIYYEAEKGGVDFLLRFKEMKTIPVEVGYGKKKLKQVYRSIERNNSPYGLLISNRTSSIKIKDNIICIPLLLFAL